MRLSNRQRDTVLDYFPETRPTLDELARFIEERFDRPKATVPQRLLDELFAERPTEPFGASPNPEEDPCAETTFDLFKWIRDEYIKPGDVISYQATADSEPRNYRVKSVRRSTIHESEVIEPGGAFVMWLIPDLGEDLEIRMHDQFFAIRKEDVAGD